MRFIDSHLNHWFKAPNANGTYGYRSFTKTSMKQSKAQLRQLILQQRRKLNQAALLKAAKGLFNTANSNAAISVIFANAKKILSYSAFNGEISPHLITQSLTASIYLPKIMDYNHCLMQFFPAEQAKAQNRFGINEPSGDGEPIEITQFDAVFVPLVGFDQTGNRLGMGGGFYDRALSNISSVEQKPLLIGLAHGFQEFSTLSQDVWDVPLDVILTNQKIIDPKNILTI